MIAKLDPIHWNGAKFCSFLCLFCASCVQKASGRKQKILHLHETIWNLCKVYVFNRKSSAMILGARPLVQCWRLNQRRLEEYARQIGRQIVETTSNALACITKYLYTHYCSISCRIDHGCITIKLCCMYLFVQYTPPKINISPENQYLELGRWFISF